MRFVSLKGRMWSYHTVLTVVVVSTITQLLLLQQPQPQQQVSAFVLVSTPSQQQQHHHHHHRYSLPTTTTTTTTTTYKSSITKSTRLYAIGTLVKRAKLYELQQYIQQNQPLPSDVMACYEQIQAYSKENTNGIPNNNNNNNATTTSTTSTIGPLQQALTKRKGTLSVIAEYKRPTTTTTSVSVSSIDTLNSSNDSATESSTSTSTTPTTTPTTSSSIWDIDLLSPIFREAGVTGMAILADTKMGGCSYEHDLPFIVQEQDRIRKANVIPGPMYIINSDIIVDPLQVARTAAIRTSSSTSMNRHSNNDHRSNLSEIAAIVLQYNIVVTSTTGTTTTTTTPTTLDDIDDDTTLLVELIQAARALDLEVIVTVTDTHQAQTAIDLGVSIICVMAPVVSDPILQSTTLSTSSSSSSSIDTKRLRTNNTFVDAQIACIEHLQYPEYNTNVCFLAHIPVKSDNTQWNEIEDVWYIRDTHMFQGIYVSDILYKGQVASTTFTGSNDSIEHPGSIIKAMISKSSKLWGVVTTRSGRGEGAREYLGDIMM